jgi:hypothetical protein
MFASKHEIACFIEGVTSGFRRSGTLYLVGEGSLVLEGKRSFCSEVIVAGDIEPDDAATFQSAVDDAASGVGLAVAIEHPADVIPLPDGAASRARPVTGFDDGDESLRVRHFDPYTTAIRFVARGDEPDYDLVVAFLEMGWIDSVGLEREVLALLPRFSFETIQQDPAEFRRKYKGLKQMWLAQSRGRVGV